MEHAEPRRNQQERRNPDVAVERLVEQQDDRNACDDAEEQILEKDQHRSGFPAPRLRQNPQQGEPPRAQSGWRNTPGQES